LIPPALRLSLRGGAAQRADGNRVKGGRGGAAQRVDGDSVEGRKRRTEHKRKESGDGEGEVSVRLAAGGDRDSVKRAAKRTRAREEAEERGEGSQSHKVKRPELTDADRLKKAERREKKEKKMEKDKLKTAKEAAVKEQGVKGWVPGASKVRQMRITPGKEKAKAGKRAPGKSARAEWAGLEAAGGRKGKIVKKKKSELDVRMKKWENVAEAAKKPGAVQEVKPPGCIALPVLICSPHSEKTVSRYSCSAEQIGQLSAETARQPN